VDLGEVNFQGFCCSGEEESVGATDRERVNDDGVRWVMAWKSPRGSLSAWSSFGLRAKHTTIPVTKVTKSISNSRAITPTLKNL
jgi:hypothetical protein